MIPEWLAAPSAPTALVQLGVGLCGAMLFAVAVGGAKLLLSHAGRIRFGRLRTVLSRLDQWVARDLADKVGMAQSSAIRRWTTLVAVLAILAVCGAMGPSLLAWPALLIAFVVMVAVARRWAWDEEDRAAGTPPELKRIPGREDYGNELLLVLSCIFLFGAVFVWRLEQAGVFQARPDQGLLASLLYIGWEALDALPVVGNIEVFGYDNPSGIDLTQPTGGGFAFALRIALDLLVIGGVLKLGELAVRIARDEDLRRYEDAVEVGDDVARGRALRSLAAMVRRGSLKAADRLQTWAAPEPGRPKLEPARRFAVAETLFGLFDAPGGYGGVHVAAEAMMDIGNSDLDALHRLGGVHYRLGHALTFLGGRAPQARALELWREARTAFITALKAVPSDGDLGMRVIRLRDVLMADSQVAELSAPAPSRRLAMNLDRLLTIANAAELADAPLAATLTLQEAARLVDRVGAPGRNRDQIAALTAKRDAAAKLVDTDGNRTDPAGWTQAMVEWSWADLALAGWLPQDEALALCDDVAHRLNAAYAGAPGPELQSTAGLAIAWAGLLQMRVGGLAGLAQSAGNIERIESFLARGRATPALWGGDWALLLMAGAQAIAITAQIQSQIWREKQGGALNPHQIASIRNALRQQAELLDQAIDGFADPRMPHLPAQARLERALLSTVMVEAGMADEGEMGQRLDALDEAIANAASAGLATRALIVARLHRAGLRIADAPKSRMSNS